MTMKKILGLTTGFLVLATSALAVAAYRYLKPRSEWTSPSSEAVEEFTQGLADLASIYVPDAVRHFERALELDPDFALAKLQLASRHPSDTERKRYLTELADADLEGLSERERFLVRYALARTEGRTEAQEILDAYRATHPRDPYGLRAECDVFWDSQRFDDAERCYRRLFELHPEWVESQNRLGYLAMARGRFEEAEEHFLTYRFVAPDQANPHHSLSELLTLLGRYEEAEEALDETIRIKPDFCAAYVQRVMIAMWSGRPEGLEDTLRAMGDFEACAEEAGRLSCAARAWTHFHRGEFQNGWQLIDGECRELTGEFDLLAHRLSLATGRLDRGAEMEAKLRQVRAEVEAADRPVYASVLAAIDAHMQGVRRIEEGDYPAAVERFSQVDHLLGYWWGTERVNLKLFNRLNLLGALELAGREAEARDLRLEIDAVNPRLVDECRLPDLESPASDRPS